MASGTESQSPKTVTFQQADSRSGLELNITVSGDPSDSANPDRCGQPSCPTCAGSPRRKRGRKGVRKRSGKRRRPRSAETETSSHLDVRFGPSLENEFDDPLTLSDLRTTCQCCGADNCPATASGYTSTGCDEGDESPPPPGKRVIVSLSPGQTADITLTMGTGGGSAGIQRSDICVDKSIDTNDLNEQASVQRVTREDKSVDTASINNLTMNIEQVGSDSSVPKVDSKRVSFTDVSDATTETDAFPRTTTIQLTMSDSDATDSEVVRNVSGNPGQYRVTRTQLHVSSSESEPEREYCSSPTCPGRVTGYNSRGVTSSTTLVLSDQERDEGQPQHVCPASQPTCASRQPGPVCPAPTCASRQLRPVCAAPTCASRQLRPVCPAPTCASRQPRPVCPAPTCASRQSPVCPAPTCASRQPRRACPVTQPNCLSREADVPDDMTLLQLSFKIVFTTMLFTTIFLTFIFAFFAGDATTLEEFCRWD
ncbi:hypothetical protein BaRGS_00035952 [Batillaria attramentaria]|uniref:Uncharacterized protein n=1 Tax=Batillaria attramentaria TaxID=370345 RepID=A0ABD0JD35_9CAEN